MKYIIHIISVFLLATVLASCTDNEAMRQRISYVSQCNRADTVFTEKWLPTVDSLVSYFDRHGNANEKMMAHYIKGRVHHDMGDAPQALACYRDATNVADTTSKDCDFKTLSRVYGQMALLFHRQRTPILEIEYTQKAARMAYRAKDTLNAIIFEGGVCSAYDIMNEKDSVLATCLKTANRFQNVGREDLAAATLGVTIGILIDRHRLSEAKEMIETYEEKSGYFDHQGNIIRGKEIFYGIKGKYYFLINNFDSAEYYYRKLLRYSSDPTHKASGYHGLMNIYQQMNKPDSITKYASLYADANDSSTILHSSEEIVRMQSIYNYNEKQKLVDQKTIEAERYKNSLYIFIVLGFISIMLLIHWWRKHRQKALIELRETNATYAEAMTQYNLLRQDIEELGKDYGKYRQTKECELEKLRIILSTFQDDKSRPECWEIETAILRSSIVKRFHQLASNLTVPSEKEWEDLRHLLHDSIPSFYQHIFGEHLHLTENEKKASMLIRLRFIPSELVILLGLSKQRVTNIRSNINRKLFHTEGTKLLDSHIRGL
ncbi:MAG: hypothetical protein IJL54_06710 [Prevotella sp.]|nr:hypothetical protein [Prevotella sp.]